MQVKAMKNKGSRRLVLLDIENLAGSPLLTGQQVLGVCSDISRAYPLEPRDLVYVGGHVGNAFPCDLAARITHGSVCLLRGRDAADRALINRATEVPLEAFNSDVHPITECVIGSGDRIFVDVAIEMKSRGLYVTVLSRSYNISRKLSQVADRVVLLDDPTHSFPQAA